MWRAFTLRKVLAVVFVPCKFEKETKVAVLNHEQIDFTNQYLSEINFQVLKSLRR
jgi:hypothetical protein